MRIAALLAVTIACGSSSSESPPPPGGKVEIVEAPPTGDLVTYVHGEVARGLAEHVPVLVYVGATWCEPCREFHAAAEAGTLDAALGPLRLLEFDVDRDGTYLEAAGYRSQLVPLFARPGSDGRASGKQIEGARKGGDYVRELTPRVRELLAR